ncbi:hypothetical protein QJS10_CPA03g00819 [Acorus calamus]|uniref:Uncharacterized protein n=1 Tax=Acorus calamus TaxID=4465 RepID=A0AAV9F3Q0_ACOCL|nr:hypothetical protein QJS10_CPA03g00819 [Acorus calamus]
MALVKSVVVHLVLMMLFLAQLFCFSAAAGPKGVVAVEGTVFCRSCNKTLVGAPPLAGAIASVKCNDTKAITVLGRTNKNGYFYIQLPKLKLSPLTTPNCKAYLVSSPSPACNKTSNLRGGIEGSPLTLKALYPGTNFPGRGPLAVFTVGPLAFAPSRCPKPSV